MNGLKHEWVYISGLTTVAVDASTLSFQAEYMQCLNILVTVPIEFRNAGLIEFLHRSTPAFRDKMTDIAGNEEFHRKLVKVAMRELGITNSTHDWTKDWYYFYISSSKYDFGITPDEVLNREYTRVVHRHYFMEPHHPQWEAYHNASCSPIDILEMACDRCSRNIWANKGKINMEDMKTRFLPTFTFDHARKLEEYKENVVKAAPVVTKCYNELIVDFNSAQKMAPLIFLIVGSVIAAYKI